MTETAPDVIIDAGVGKPAGRMGDVTGDGLSDLVFIRPTTLGNFALTIIAGGNAGGVELPRHITSAWITATLAIPGQSRVRAFGYSPVP